jgi:hypothetical protein
MTHYESPYVDHYYPPSATINHRSPDEFHSLMPRLTSSARSLKHGSQATRRKACATWQKRGAKGGDFWQRWD